MNKSELIADLKTLILEVCDKPAPSDGFQDEELLFGPTARLGLDSLDALQLSMALQKKYGVRLADSKETRRVLSSVNNLADYLLSLPPK
ncbi:MAG: acyl carrier protein [Gammaproteobacteria bacterium]|nr:acyl carrier protein [Gammaproteobacteria bacterium]